MSLFDPENESDQEGFLNGATEDETVSEDSDFIIEEGSEFVNRETSVSNAGEIETQALQPTHEMHGPNVDASDGYQFESVAVASVQEEAARFEDHPLVSESWVGIADETSQHSREGISRADVEWQAAREMRREIGRLGGVVV